MMFMVVCAVCVRHLSREGSRQIKRELELTLRGVEWVHVW